MEGVYVDRQENGEVASVVTEAGNALELELFEGLGHGEQGGEAVRPHRSSNSVDGGGLSTCFTSVSLFLFSLSVVLWSSLIRGLVRS